jgi:hypothetical protein
MITEDTITELNGLIRTCKDAEFGYRTAAADVRNTELETVFTERNSAVSSPEVCRPRSNGWAAIRRIPGPSPGRCCGVGWT